MKHLIAGLCIATVFSSAQDMFTMQEHGEAPSRTYHVLHYKIDVTLDEAHKSVAGNVTITLIPLLTPLNTVELYATKMKIDKVTLGKKELQFDTPPDSVGIWVGTTAHRLIVHLDKSYSSKDTLNLRVDYSCTPKRGMTFAAPDSAYPKKRRQIWSQGEDTTNHYWFPCYDFPNDKATSEVIATVNSKFTVLSNGKLISVKEDKKKGTRTFHWKQSKPHVSYLIMVAAGEYTILRDKVGKLPLEFYAYPDDTLDARLTFKETANMIKFFNEKISFVFPWEKYGQIILQDHFGGMENTGATTLSDNWAVPDMRSRLDDSPSTLIAHELAHQWWGDVVTCKDWRHIWLNESFASYFDPLYHEYSLGRDEFDYRMYGSQQSGVNVDTTRGRRPIVSVGSYGENVYQRGASVLHMLRFLLGDELFWRAINHYITKYQFQSIETNDFKNAIEEATGQNLYWFFDQWLYKAGHPIFDVSYTWSDSAKAIFLSVKQTQKMDSVTGVFRMPVDVEVTTSSGKATHRVNILTGDTTFTLPPSEKPLLVIFDKGNWLLKELKFQKSNEEWKYQAKFATNPIDRIRALQAMAQPPSSEEFIPVFVDRMLNDPFWAVRREAVTQSDNIEVKNDSLKNILKSAFIQAYRDKKAPVRGSALSALKKFKGDNVVNILQTALKDSSYNVISNALRSFAKVDSVKALSVVQSHLTYPSFRNSVHNTAMSVLASLDSVQGIKFALADAKYGRPTTTRYNALGILSRYGKGRADVLTFYESLAGDKNEGIRATSVRMLGDIGNEATITLLQPIAEDTENAASAAAKASIAKIKKRLAEMSKEATHCPHE